MLLSNFFLIASVVWCGGAVQKRLKRNNDHFCRKPCQVQYNWVNRDRVTRDLGLTHGLYTVRRHDEKWNVSKVSINLGVCYGNCQSAKKKTVKGLTTHCSVTDRSSIIVINRLTGEETIGKKIIVNRCACEVAFSCS